MDVRSYDPALGRFNSVDLMSEEAYSLTPFRFGYNNPVSYNDPTGLWEEIEGGHKTKDKDEIERLFNFIKDKGNANIDQIDSFIKEDIAFTEELESGNSFLLSNVNLKFGEEIKGGQLLRLRNEISYYQGKTSYLYNQEDFKLRDKVFSSRRGAFLQKEILRNEDAGNFMPLTAKNHINLVGRDVAHLQNYAAYADMMSWTQPGHQKISRAVQARYLGRIQGGVKARISPGTATSSTVTSNNTTPYLNNISFRDFHRKYSHLFRGRYKGRGMYMKYMAMAWRKFRLGME